MRIKRGISLLLALSLFCSSAFVSLAEEPAEGEGMAEAEEEEISEPEEEPEDTEEESEADSDTEEADAAEAEEEETDVPVIDDDDPMRNGRPNEESALADNNGISAYSLKSTGKIKAYGIDVSYHNGEINWTKVAAAGIDFAMIRVGYRGSSNGTLVTDTQAINNLKGAQSAGVKIGVYFYSTAKNTTEAEEEAKYVVNIIKDYKISYPVAYDCEGYYDKTSRDYSLSNSTRTNNAIAFLDYVQSKGYTGMMYASKSAYAEYWDTSTLEERYPIWVAQYPYRTGTTQYSSHKQAVSDSKSTTYSGAYQMWQFSDAGSVSGISGKVDLDFDYNTTGSVSSGVTGLKATAQTTSSISLSWSKYSGADGYQVKRKTGDGSYETATTTTSTSYKDTSLKAGTTYSYKVRAYTINDSGGKDYLPYSAVLKVPTKPKAPTSFKGSATAFDTIKLSWGKVSGASGYQVQRYNSSSKKYTTVKTVSSGSTKSYSNGSLNASTKYKYRIRAYITVSGTKTYSAYSDVISVKTKGSVKGTVTGSNVNLRSGAGTSYKSYKKVKKGKSLTITGSSGNWYRTSTTVKGKKKTCYISKKYVKVKSSSSSKKTYSTYKTTAKVNYRSGAGTSKSVKGTLKKGTKIQVEKGYSKKANGYTWYRFKKNGKNYYIASKYLKKT